MKLTSYLVNKGFSYKESAGQHVFQRCPFCQDEKHHFYVDPDKDVFFCHKCGAKGNVKTMKEKFGDAGESFTSFKQAAGQKKEFKKPPKAYDEQCHADYYKSKAAMDFMKARGIQGESIEHFKIGYAKWKGKDCISVPYYENGVLGLVKFRAIDDKDFQRFKDCKSTIFNQDCIPEYDEIIITEGEFDAIMCWQMGYKNVVSVPNGAQTFDNEWLDLFENMGRIYLWYDNDEKGIEGSDAVAERLGLDRCFFIRPQGFKDANEYFLANQEIDWKKTFQKKIKHIVSFQESVLKIFERRELQAHNPIKTPWEKVNRLLGKIEPGDLITLSATPKIGKTCLSLNIATFNAKQGHPVLFYCLEMRPERLATKVVCAESMVPEEELTREIVTETVNRMGDIPLHFGHNYKNIEADTIFNTMRSGVRRFGVKLLVFDHLHFLVRSLAHTTAEIGMLSRRFKLLAEELSIPIILIAQPRKVEEDKVMTMNDLKDSSSIGADSDQVVILWRKKTKSKAGKSCDSSYEPETLVRVDASRFMPGGDCVLYYKGEIARFEEITNG